jgi:mono/diheme cytochrome c family protein/plastocyanin
MTDQPRGPEQRLPAPRPEPTVPAPADRFTSPPATRRFELTPERAAGIVRQSASARWVGFLAISIVVLFVIVYYFYELGLPGGLSASRLASEADAQQVSSVERGYNLYEANCARCHGVNGEGGIGPTLNRQDKLFDHLNPDYVNNVLHVGGRYVCGDPNSLMPIWADTGNPPGPLNYKQVQDIINFIRADNTQTYTAKDPSLNEPVIDPATGKAKTFTGWVDPNYQPAPGSTPYPACWKTEFSSSAAPAGSAGPAGGASSSPATSASAGTSGSPAASGSAAASGSPAASASGAASGGSGQTVDVSASGVAFEQSALKAPAGAAFTLHFDNKDAGIPHNVDIKDASGASVFKGEVFPGAAAKDYNVPALKAGSYTFVCDVHPNMTGTLTAGS